MTSNKEFFYAQGARCGHIEGKGRAGQYVVGEELLASYEAADAQSLGSVSLANEWAKGYRYGYKLAAEGSALDESLATF